ncbi:MAG: hypothetical protein IJW96_02225 [Clostridia bacterium]|nr:hypothetical protein [Clostridia bacterium]
MKKGLKIGIFIGVLAFSWIFFIFEEELAFYGIYNLTSYGVHEIAGIIPMLGILATVVAVFLEVMYKRKNKEDKQSKWFICLFLCLTLLQSSWFIAKSDDVYTSAVGTVVETNVTENRIVVEKELGAQKVLVELKAPGTFCNMVKVGEQYFFTYVYDKDTPNEGKMDSVSLLED